MANQLTGKILYIYPTQQIPSKDGNPLIKLDVRGKSVTLLAKELGGAKRYVDILIGKGYSVRYDLFYNL